MTGLPKGGYGIISRTAMRSDKISKEAKAVYALLCSYTGSKHYCYPTVATISKDLGASERTIIRLTEELQANGFVKKVKIPTNKRKTAYVPLVPTGAIGDMDDTISEIGDTDDTQIGDTHGTLILTDNINSKKSAAAEDWFIKSKQVKTESKKPKKSNLLIIEEIQPLMDILTQNKVPLSTINNEVRGLMRSAVEQHGIELCKSALRGRIIQADAKGTDLYLRAFFSPDKSDWLGGCAKLAAKAEQVGQNKSDPNHGYKSQIRPELADEYENAGRVAI